MKKVLSFTIISTVMLIAGTTNVYGQNTVTIGKEQDCPQLI